MRLLLTSLMALLILTGCTGQAFLNSLTPSRGYELAANLIYDQGKNLRLDIYSPPNVQNAPVVVFFFGGRWSEGDKDQYTFVGEALASRGFVAVLPNYRLYPTVRFPEFVNDGARAVAWLRDNVATYGGSPDKIFVMGHSAGAHLAAMLAVREEFLAQAGGSRSWLRGMIGLAGPYDFLPITDPTLRDVFGPPESFQQSQPILFANGDNPPMLLMHGEDDEIVFVKNTRNMADAIKRAGGPIETVIYPKMSHRYIVASLAKPLRGQTDVIQHVSEFVNRWATAPRSAIRPPDADPGIQTMPLPIN
ncbi:alpha/beta hydrolase [Panacagrimonas sp.]|uniref:alpha/beta hydrolase n=1 Tax=Panacagrimonas sp. TaxID=2480088 RepID=UPI003B51A1B9